MTIKNIIKILVEEKGYDLEKTEAVASEIEDLSEDIRAAFENWLETDESTSPEYNGYTVEKIMEKKPDMTILTAYLTLDWIRSEPEEAIGALLTPIINFIPPELPDLAEFEALLNEYDE